LSPPIQNNVFLLTKVLTKFGQVRVTSVDIELGYKNQRPPEILYHGTGEKSVQPILKKGLEKRTRRHVHLSIDIETAAEVGRRHGKPVVFKVFAGQMYDENFEFFLSDNGVWLTDRVPIHYLKIQTKGEKDDGE
jgi:putative RNA 2'-phosphotransferase